MDDTVASANVNVSLGEAECHFAATSCAAAVMLKGLIADVGTDVECYVQSDRSMAGSLSYRIGPGLRIQLQHNKFLSLQKKFQDGDFARSQSSSGAEPSRRGD